jgi:ribosomal protein L40E
MAEKKIGAVELQWTCPNCNGLNPGSARFCLSCGAAQPEDVQFFLPERQELITDKEVIAKAAAGPDIHCPYCGARNPAGSSNCGQCGGDLTGGIQREAGKVLGAFETGPVKKITCPNCGQENVDTALKCAYCGASLAPEPEPAPVVELSTAVPKKTNPLLIAGLVGLGVLVCFILVWIFIQGSRTTNQMGTVQEARWEYALPIEALVPVEYRDWADEIPADAEIGVCQQQVREVVSQPVPNSVEVCGTPYTRDTGSGFAEVVQDCQYEVYADYCAYTVTEWRQVNVAVASGSGFSPAWPDPALESGQRLGQGSEIYTVRFIVEDGSAVTYSPPTFQEFQLFQPGTTWTLVINGFGDLVDVEP